MIRYCKVVETGQCSALSVLPSAPLSNYLLRALFASSKTGVGFAVDAVELYSEEEDRDKWLHKKRKTCISRWVMDLSCPLSWLIHQRSHSAII